MRHIFCLMGPLESIEPLEIGSRITRLSMGDIEKVATAGIGLQRPPANAVSENAYFERNGFSFHSCFYFKQDEGTSFFQMFP